jgi:hypothetical protein
LIVVAVGPLRTPAVAQAAPDLGALDQAVGAEARVAFVLPGNVVLQGVAFPRATSWRREVGIVWNCRCAILLLTIRIYRRS